jgi:hypothetical protein
MKCHSHPDVDAQGICIYCGKALCKACVQTSQSRIVCSGGCAAKLSSQDAAIAMIRTKTLNQNRMTGLFSCLTGAAFALFAVVNLLRPGWRDLGLFLVVFSAVLFIAGYRFLKLSKEA